LGQHFAALKNDMVFEGLKTNTKVGQSTADMGVAGQCIGLVVVVGIHLLHTQFVGEARYFISGHGMAHDEACTRLARHSVQFGIQRHQ